MKVCMYYVWSYVTIIKKKRSQIGGAQKELEEEEGIEWCNKLLILWFKCETPHRGSCVNTCFPAGASIKEGSGNSKSWSLHGGDWPLRVALGSAAELLVPASLSDSWSAVYKHLLPHCHTAMNSAMPCPHCWTETLGSWDSNQSFSTCFCLSVRWLVTVIQKVTKIGNWCQRYEGATLITPGHRSLCLWNWIAEECGKVWRCSPVLEAW